MASSSLSEMASTALEEISKVFSRAEEMRLDPLGKLVEEIAAARDRNARIVLYGVGREGLMLKALAMRLFHLGLDASCVGDMTAPRIGRGDLLVTSAGPGSFSTVDALVRVANEAGARVIVLTAQLPANVPVAPLAHALVVLPARTMADDVASATADVAFLPMGSVYEGALFVLFEMVVVELRTKMGESVESMRARHTNLE